MLGKSTVQGASTIVDLSHMVLRENSLPLSPLILLPSLPGEVWSIFGAYFSPCKHCKHRKVGGLPAFRL